MAGLRATAPELDVDGYSTPVGRQVLGVVERECVTEADAIARDSLPDTLAFLHRVLDNP
ncbi:hypothetical protein APR11_000515 [Nocardia amikacinitolerans]|uniref:hypothetical protein n=1 Tax=Nocardia amikacinitolerans TaxID=756689 RepID=UPI003556E959|nr:hypothetical protein [Nocardia amikacinitolerans]